MKNERSKHMKGRAFFTTLLVILLLASLLATYAAAQGPGKAVSETPTAEEKVPEKPEPEALPEIGVEAPIGIEQVATDYAFSSSSGTYTEIITGTVHGTPTNDDTSFNAINLGFTFRYNNANYTQVSIQSNGFIAMGASVSSSYTPISSGSSNNVVAALARDLQGNGTTSQLMSLMEGSEPNRVFTIQWKHYKRYGTANAGDDFNFQIKLYETSNLVEIVYGTVTMGNATAATVQVGLRGASNADFNNRMTDATHDWSDSLPGTANSSTMALDQTVFPASGLTYDWTPPPPHPILDNSYKTAPVRAVIGDLITYTVHIANSGDLEADNAWMNDAIPGDTSYVPGSVDCSAGTCEYAAAGDMITWTGSVDIGAQVVVTFSVDTAGAACGNTIVNTAVISDPAAISTKLASASTQPVYEAPWLDEGFEDPTFPPDGWVTMVITDTGTDPAWSRVTAGTYPTINPHSGAAMAKFNSFNASAGGTALLSTPVLDLSAPNLPPLRFWMSHDTGYSSNDDRIQIWVSTDGWATHQAVGDPVSRYDATCGTPCWKQHTVDLTGYTSAAVQIGFLGISAYGNNFYLDDATIANAWYPCPEVTIGPDQSGAVCPGNTLEYPLEVYNNYPTADTIDLALTGNAWPTSLSATSLALGPGASAMVTATVEVPWYADGGDNDLATITATGQSSGLSDDAQIQSAAQLGSGWNDLAPSPYGARYLAVVYDNGHLYQIGGNDAVGYHDGTYAYDIAADTWMTMTSMITPTYYMDGAAIDGNIYIPGGQSAAASWNAFVQVYSTTADTWNTVAPMPIPLRYHEVVAYNGLLYVLGGQTTGSAYSPAILIYDPATDSWTTGAPMPTAVAYAASGVMGGKIYLAGGYNGTYQTALQIYDPATDSWSQGAPLPYGWVQAADGVKHDRYLILAGGYYDSLATASVYALFYDAVNDAWAFLPDANSLRYGAEGDSDGNEFYYVAGREYDGTWFYSNRNEHMVQCPETMPGIVIEPPALDAELCPDETTVLTFTICNTGTAPLSWNIQEMTSTAKLVGTTLAAPATPATLAKLPTVLPGLEATAEGTESNAPSAPDRPEAVLWDQPQSMNNGGISDYFLEYGAGAFSADDFASADWWAIDTLYVNGFINSGSIVDAYTLDWLIYPDAGGVPAGYPGDGAPTAVWGLSLTAGDPAVTLGNDDVTLDVVAALGSPLYLPPGTYWLVFYPAINGNVLPPWYWFGADPQLTVSQLIDPDDLFGAGFTSWTPWDLIGVTTAFAFRLEGETTSGVPWLSAEPTGGLLDAQECATVDVRFDSTDLLPGDYMADLAIHSNDPVMPTVTLPVTLTVWEPVNNAGFDWMPITPTVGATVSFTGTASGQTPIAFDWDFGDSTIGAGETVTHVYAAAGDYEVIMMATNACGYDVVTYTVTVELPIPEKRYYYLPIVVKNYSTP
jgi:uncharacterized repeat protein (TIGR01451 family)